MNKQSFLSTQKQLIEALGSYYRDDDEMLVFVIYGYDDDGVQGWHVVQTDYPHFTMLLLGESFEEAMATAQQWAQEADEEDEDDGE